jgi:hypothetical protein
MVSHQILRVLLAAIALLGGFTARADDGVFAHPLSAAQAASLLGAATRQLAGAAAIRGNFSQEKQLHELPQPLRADGDFLVARDVGIYWHTRTPFDSELVLSPQGLVQRTPGSAPQRMDAAAQPALRTVTQIFDALFALDLPQLDKTFTLYGEPQRDGWRLGLRPREPAFAAVMAGITVDGNTQPRTVQLTEGNGDLTEIHFSDLAVLPKLGDAERQRFVQ